jgi:hypothetical protein
MSGVLGGIPFSDLGALQVQLRPSTGVPSTEPVNGGWAMAAALNAAYFEDAGAAVPATAVKLGGIAFTPDGAIYITQSTTGTFASIGGHKVRSDGALLVKVGTPTAATDPYLSGWAHDGATRAAYVGGEGMSFVLPLADLGAGAVDTTLVLGAGSATFTRATTATTILSTGLMANVASGTARSLYSPAGVYLGYFAEGARTNLVLQAENFGTTWVAVGTPTRVAGSTTLGTLTMDTIGDDSAVALEGYTQVITFTADAVKAISVYVKQGTATSSVIRVRDTTLLADRLLATITWTGSTPVVTMTTGTDLTGTPQQHAATGIYRLSFATTSVTAASVNQLEVYPATDAALAVANTGTIIAGGVQAENATFPGSYIPTTTATVTRNADVLTYQFTGNADPSSGSVYVELSTLWSAASGATNTAVGFDASGFGPMFVPNLASTVIRMSDGTTANPKTGLTDMSTGIRKRASSWGTGQSITGDGATVATAAFDGTIAGTVSIAIGSNTSGAVNWFGTIKNGRIWKRQLPDATLQAITA